MSEIKKGSGPNGLPPVHFRILAYKTTNAVSSYMAWTVLDKSTYDLYIMVSDNNPFDTANFGPITKYTITPEVPKWGFMVMTFEICALVIILGIMF